MNKGPSLYYVRVFWGFFEPPTHLRKDNFTTSKGKLPFSGPPTPMSLRNMKMAPNEDYMSGHLQNTVSTTFCRKYLNSNKY